MELGPAGRGPGQVEPPQVHRVLVDGSHDALGIGVGAGDQVERFVLRWMDDVSLATEPEPGTPPIAAGLTTHPPAALLADELARAEGHLPGGRHAHGRGAHGHPIMCDQPICSSAIG